MRPDTSVPVTTVPNPRIVNARSTGSRAAPSVARAGTRPARSRKAERSAGRPAPVRADTATTGAPASGDPVEERVHLETRDADRLFVYEIRLRQHHDAVPHAEQTTDLKVLARLRHDGFVGGDDEHDRVDPARAGQHVADEPLMTGHVHERDLDVPVAPVREPEVDGDAARLLLFQPIGVGAGERQDEAALPMVDVAGRADHERGHGHQRARRREGTRAQGLRGTGQQPQCVRAGKLASEAVGIERRTNADVTACGSCARRVRA